MRGADEPQTTLFSYLSVEDRIPADHPLRTIHARVNPILAALSPKFEALYSRMGRPSILRSPPPSTGGTKNPAVDFRGEKRSKATHQSVTDPDARIARKSNGTASIVGHLGIVLMDNRHGVIVATDVRAPSDDAERDAAVAMLRTLPPRQRRRHAGRRQGLRQSRIGRGRSHVRCHAARRPERPRPEITECHR